MSRKNRPDKFFFGLVVLLALAGFLVFTSASLGLLGKSGASFTLVAVKQGTILLVGLAALLGIASIPLTFWKKYALHILIFSALATLLVFIPGLGLSSGGAKRWILIPLGPMSFSFQPAELLKIGFIIYLAAWMSGLKEKITTLDKGFLPFLVLLAIPGAILLSQPNTSMFAVIVIASLAMFLVAGGKFKHLAILGLVGAVILTGLVFTRPYVKARIMTYIHPQEDVNGSSYQINQALIAIGSGGIFGRGFGQSVQKFNFLPEPIGDSIFAVAAEEFGLIGSGAIVVLFLLFALWGLKISSRSSDSFGRLLALGIVILITAQSFINIGAMLGLIPLTGAPLIFVSQGGSALLLALIEAGIILNISRAKTVK